MRRPLTLIIALTLTVGLGVTGPAGRAATVAATTGADRPLPTWFTSNSQTSGAVTDSPPASPSGPAKQPGLGAEKPMTAPPIPTEPLPNQVWLREEDKGQRVELRERQTLIISLESHPSTGYVWEIDSIDPTALRQIGEPRFEASSSLLGAPSRWIATFAALKPMESKLTLAYRRPWEDEAPLKTFKVDVEGVGTFSSKRRWPAAPTTTEPIQARDETVLDSQAAANLPSSFNWCDQGGCTPVKNQGYCGSCWAFATAGVVESAIQIQDGVSRNLSEQYLVSCNEDGYNCTYGGWWAFDYYVHRIPYGELDAGAVYEVDFPYTATDAPCDPPHPHYEKVDSYGYVSGWSIPSVSALKQAIYEHGPVAAAVCVGNSFYGYGGGVFETDEAYACGSGGNHGVILVGWDDNQGQNGIWYLKNSWGGGWGEGGYMRIGYGISNVGFGASYVGYIEAAPECYWADIDCNCIVDSVDISLVAAAWRCAEGDTCYNAAYDIDQDGSITIVDIEQIAKEWGWSCSS